MKRSFACLMVIGSLLLFDQTAYGTHVPPSSSILEYDGQITDTNTSFTELIDWSSSPSDGYDWYSMDVFGDQEVTFEFTRFSGDFLPNLHVYDGIGNDGDMLSDIGPLLFDAPDNSDLGDITFSWTPTSDDWVTVAVSTWTGETGDYQLVVMGAAPATDMPSDMTPVVPEPSTFTLGILGLLSLGMFGRRRRSR